MPGYSQKGFAAVFSSPTKAAKLVVIARDCFKQIENQMLMMHLKWVWELGSSLVSEVPALRAWEPKFDPQEQHSVVGVVVHACNPTTW